jgi:hypothetical protein
MLKKPLTDAYFKALFSMTVKGHTFAIQAHELVRDLSDPHISISELLEDIDRNPCNTFELHLKHTAYRMLKKKEQ